jgi:hypothetical protein
MEQKELFVDYISKESYKFTSQSSRKTLQRKDIEQAINHVDALYFLECKPECKPIGVDFIILNKFSFNSCS